MREANPVHCSGMLSPSKTMQAIGIDGKPAKEFIRISFGTSTSKEGVRKLADSLVELSRNFFQVALNEG
ncbi:hypothetical protein [Bacillus sp. FJAT-27225]|uniref:hypothetical protein n=1 Tax=Bacillus sp. FJAT-27225 TaxID=1743144 RepID=UPI001586F77A|nr:hypothetical protein [Bacillus sp. FJAT-27225]